MKKSLLLLPLLATLLIPGCQGEQKKTDDVMINDFETVQELSLMKFPLPKHSDRGKFDLSDKHVTHGEKSLKYTNIYGAYVEMCHYFDHISGGDIDITNIKSLELDIYNDSDFDSSCIFLIYSGKEMLTLLDQEYELKKGEMTHLSFPLSKLALQYNYESITSTSLRIFTPKTDYDKGIGYTFYFDNWHAKMNSEYTEDDKSYQPKIDQIKNKIDTFSNPRDVSLSDEPALTEVANLLNELPALYRRAVPNISKYYNLIDSYYELASAFETIDYDRNAFMNFDKFYGSAQLKPFGNTRAEVLYSEEKWPGNEEYGGSTKIVFSGALDNTFTYQSNVDLNDFDFVHICVHNASENFLRVWFSYGHDTFIDVPSGATSVVSFATSQLSDQYYWAFHQLRSATDGTIIAASGSVYLRQFYVTGRSQETLQTHMKHAFDTLPEPDNLINEDDYLKGLTSIDAARKLYETVTDKTTVAEADLAKLETLEAKVDENGYGISFNAYSGAMAEYSFGEKFSAEQGVFDDEFGFVTTALLTNVPPHKDNPKMHEQAFTFASSVVMESKYKGYAFFIYNPTSYTLPLVVRNTTWEWPKYSHLFTNTSIAPGWNKIEVKSELLEIDSSAPNISIFTSDEGKNLSLSGTWKFSSLFGLPRSI